MFLKCNPIGAPSGIPVSSSCAPFSKSTQRTVCLMCSELSALAGRHSYKTPEEAVVEHMLTYERTFVEEVKFFVAMEKDIHKHNYEVLLELVQQTYNLNSLPSGLDDLKLYGAKIQLLRERYPSASKKFDVLEAKEQEITTEDLPFEVAQQVVQQAGFSNIDSNVDQSQYKPTQQLSDEIAEKIKEATIPILSNANSEEIKTAILAKSTALAGTLNEVSIYGRLKSMSYDVRQLQKSFCKKFDISGHLVSVFGKVDGLLYTNDKPSRVIEIKNRKNRFWLPDYDKDQIALYEKLTDLPSTLVQCFNGELNIRDLKLRPRVKEILHSKHLVESLKQIKWYLEHPYNEKSIKLVQSLIKN